MKKLEQENKHGVPSKQWNKWPDIAQRIFNIVYDSMEQNPALFVHPKTQKIAKNQWGTVAWNAAWIAADACLESLKDIEKQVGYFDKKATSLKKIKKADKILKEIEMIRNTNSVCKTGGGKKPPKK